MANDADLVTVPQTGQLYMAPVGTAAPTTHLTALNAAFLSGDLGYWTEDGLTQAVDRSTEEIRAFQNGALIRTVVTESKVTFAVTPMETNPNSVGLYYGATVDDTDGSFIYDPGETGGERSFVLDVIDGDRIIRKYVPRGEVTEPGEITYERGAPAGYPVTITAYYDDTLGGSFQEWSSQLIAP